MPTSLSSDPRKSFKKHKLTALLLLSPLFFFGQSLTGLWTGALSNDSTTVRKDQLFEIVLTEYRGKVYGYSRSEFIVNDTLYYIVKRVKGTIQGDVCEVTDDDIIAYNFRGKLDKGIKVTSTFRRNSSDSSWYLAGTWKTNATKRYYSVTGKVDLGQEKDLAASKIFPHLEELKIANEVAFYKERNETAPVAKIAKPQRVKTEYTFKNDTAPDMAVTAPDLQRADANPAIPDLKKSDNALSRTDIKELGAGKASVAVTAPDLQRADANPAIPDLKKSDNALSRTETKELSAGKPSVAVTAPDLQRADANPAIPDLKKSDNAISRTETKELGAGKPSVAVTAPDLQRADANPTIPDLKKSDNSLSRTETKNIDAGPVNVKPGGPNTPATVNTPPTMLPDKANSGKDLAKTNTPANKPVVSTNIVQEKKTVSGPATGSTVKTNNPAVNSSVAKSPTSSTVNNTNGVKTNTPVPDNASAKKTEPVTAPVVTTPKKSIEELTKNVAVIAGRKSEFSQVVDFKADSLVFSLYDNGEIDGDTVSVILNGETIMAKQGLKASAIRKTIHIKPGVDEDFTLVLFADNLGKYPPNTGLLVVHDGEDIYHLRFSSDFQKSSGIVFRRKK